MLKKVWLGFAQVVGVGFIVWLLVTLTEQHSVPTQRDVVTVTQAPAPTATGTAGIHDFRLAARKATASVVNVYTLKQVPRRRGPYLDDPFGGLFGGPVERPATSLGSGVVVSADGFILTNNHVVEGAEEIAVAFQSGQAAAARIVGTDPETDLAVLKVETKGLTPVVFADPEGVEVGDPVLAIGNPFGVGQTVTQGIVSATGRNRLGINTFENFIQTDAAINPGNSGGALVDARGALIGINTAIYSESGGSQGIGFAIPVSLARQVMEQIIGQGRVQRGWLGIEAKDVVPGESSRANAGVLVAGVLRSGPAYAGGIRPGDRLLAIDGQPVKDTRDLINRIAAVAPGKDVELQMQRQGREQALRMQVGRRPAPAGR